MKAITSPQAIAAYIDLHKEMKLPFKMTISNYTTRIQSNLCDIHFMKTEQSNRVFAAFSKIKSQVKDVQIEKIDTDHLQYYSHSFKDENFYSDVIYNIDLKAAYATVLLNDKLIDKPTYKYICSLPKMQRLTAVGMLAGKKTIYQIDETGEPITQETIISETSDYFFYCVKRTSEIINEASQYLGNAFLFSWVDGLYFLQNEQAGMNAGKIIQEFLTEKGFKSTFDVLTEFEVICNKTYFYCKYKKDGKLKTMNVPRYENETIKKITNYLLKKEY